MRGGSGRKDLGAPLERGIGGKQFTPGGVRGPFCKVARMDEFDWEGGVGGVRHGQGG